MSWAIKGVPFVFKGVTNVMDCKTSKDVMIKAGLDWDVSKCEIMAKMPVEEAFGNGTDGFMMGSNFYKEIPNSFGIYRTDKNIPLGTVKGRYTPVQNTEVFSFFDNAIGKDKALWQTAGCFGNGERVFVSAKLPKTILVNGDPVDNYLLFVTSHDGSSGVKIVLTPIRVICQNTLNAAIKNATNYISFRHTIGVHNNIDSASDILGICNTKINHCDGVYSEMAKIKIDDKTSHNYFVSAILSPSEYSKLSETGHNPSQIVNREWNAIEATGISMKKVNTISEINKYYYEGAGQQQLVGTGWGAYNAITGYYSNVDNSHGIKRMDSIILGDKANKIKSSGDLIFTM